MRVHDEHIPDELFSEFIAQMPQVCVEVLVETDNGVLLAKRTNEPVQGEWFWPGGRLYKGEPLEDAAHRVAEEELGLEVEIEDRFGVYTHFWETSAEQGQPSRHTINIVYHVTPTGDQPTISLDAQHTETRWASEQSEEFHEYINTYLNDFY
ncbi:NUDIX domain-containing protein [Halomontanus rarus]|uniref:NUDIX domain-containing protein n=1 Tax=Halomontanus rarus TaxID=3034020 RepID=UPI001A97DFC8